jgi:hypothetical protein
VRFYAFTAIERSERVAALMKVGGGSAHSTRVNVDFSFHLQGKLEAL